jgi:hypothetical protein
LHGVSVLPRYGVLAEPPHLIENGSAFCAFYVWLRLCRAVYTTLWGKIVHGPVVNLDKKQQFNEVNPAFP